MRRIGLAFVVSVLIFLTASFAAPASATVISGPASAFTGGPILTTLAFTANSPTLYVGSSSCNLGGGTGIAFSTSAGLTPSFFCANGTNLDARGMVAAFAGYQGNGSTVNLSPGGNAGNTNVRILPLSTYSSPATSAALVAFQDSAGVVPVVTLNADGRTTYPQACDSTASPGAAVCNQAAGRAAIAGTASSAVITNSSVSATSIVTASLQTNDGTCTSIKSVIPGTGSFTVTVNAACTGTTKFGWITAN